MASLPTFTRPSVSGIRAADTHPGAYFIGEFFRRFILRETATIKDAQFGAWVAAAERARVFQWRERRIFSPAEQERLPELRIRGRNRRIQAPGDKTGDGKASSRLM